MDIRPLLNLVCATIGIVMQNKSPEEIKEVLNIQEVSNMMSLVRVQRHWSLKFKKIYIKFKNLNRFLSSSNFVINCGDTVRTGLFCDKGLISGAFVKAKR